MFFYNWEKLYKITKGDCVLIINLIKCLSGKKESNKKEYLLLLKYTNLKLHSYILDIKGMLENKITTNNDKCVYLMLASKRSYNDYKQNKIDYIKTYIVNDIVDINKLSNNRLLSIHDEKIYFKY